MGSGRVAIAVSTATVTADDQGDGPDDAEDRPGDREAPPAGVPRREASERHGGQHERRRAEPEDPE